MVIALAARDSYTIGSDRIADGAIVNADVNAAAAIARSKLATETKKYSIPVDSLRNDDGSVVDATGGAGLFSVNAAGFGTGTQNLNGEEASGNIKTDTLYFDFPLPPEYVAAGALSFQVTAAEAVGAATDSTTLSVEVWADDGGGGVGGDIAGSLDDSDISTLAVATSVITAAGLSAGDVLRCFVRVVTNDTGGAVGTIAQIYSIAVNCAVKG